MSFPEASMSSTMSLLMPEPSAVIATYAWPTRVPRFIGYPAPLACMFMNDSDSMLAAASL